jgi:3-hydroxyisobutyrate dehydrogenase-like beta-hydroxyacid dehydrogenase
MRVGFIGTGHMGNPIARHLIRAGHELVVHDRNPAAAANLLELGADWADDPRAVAAQALVILTSLPGPPEVDGVVLGADGILAGASDGTIHVDLSTSLPSAVQRLAQLEAQRGVTFVEAPLSGLASGAEAGTLSTFVGGDAAAVATVRPLLETFCAHIFHVGDVGLGNIVKLTNNLIVQGTGLFVQEALAVGVKAGIPATRLYEMWNVSSSSRWVQDIPMWLERDFENPTFTQALSAKDLGLCVEAGRELGVPMTVGSAAVQVALRALARGYGDLLRAGAQLMTIEAEAGIRIE